jgi:hypothetical protein
MAKNSVKKRARSSEARLPVLGIFRHFLASEMQPAAFLFGSVSLSAVRKRNEHAQCRMGHFPPFYGSPRYSNIHSTSLGLKNALEGLK